MVEIDKSNEYMKFECGDKLLSYSVHKCKQSGGSQLGEFSSDKNHFRTWARERFK